MLLAVGMFLGLCGATPATAAWVKIDDFESHVVGTEPSSANGWVERGVADGLIVIDGGSQVAQLLGSPNTGYNIPLGANSIADNTTGTVFFRTRSYDNYPTGRQYLQMTANATDWDWSAGNWWDHDEAGFYSRWNQGDGTSLRPHHNSGNIQDITANAWYNVWLVTDNTANTFDMYISQGADGATGDPTSVTVDTGVPLRTAAGALDHFFFAGTDSNNDTGGRLDDIYVDAAGANLNNPVPPRHPDIAYDPSATTIEAASTFTGTVGLVFTVDEMLEVTELGITANSHPGQMFDTEYHTQMYRLNDPDGDISDATLLAEVNFEEGLVPTVQFIGPSGWYQLSLQAPDESLVLLPGETYVVASYGFGENRAYINGPNHMALASEINHLGSRYTFTAGVVPTITDWAGVQYQGPTFRFRTVEPDGEIPEPATMCALGLALAGLGGYVKRRRKLA